MTVYRDVDRRGYNAVKEAGNQKAIANWREMARKNFDGLMGAPPKRVVFTSRSVDYK